MAGKGPIPWAIRQKKKGGDPPSKNTIFLDVGREEKSPNVVESCESRKRGRREKNSNL